MSPFIAKSFVGSGGGGNTAPVNTALPVVTGTPQQGTQLSSDNGSWTGSPAPTFSTEWQISATGQAGTWSDRFGPNSLFTPILSDVTFFMRSAVTATNVVTSVTAFSASTAVVTMALPFNFGGNGLGASWNEIFADEFESPISSAMWTKFWFTDGNNVVSGSTTPAIAANVSVSNGKLHLLFDGTNGGVISSNPSDGVGGHTGFQFTRGYVEWKITVPNNGSGALAQWHAVWTDGQGWPLTGEIDISEGLGGVNTAHYHYGPTAGQPENTPIDRTINFAPGTHVVGVNWLVGRLDFYVDGVLSTSITNADLTGGLTITNSPQYLIIDFVKGSGGGTAPLTLDAEYVRVWQPTSGSPPANTSLPAINNLTPIQGDALTVTNGTWTGSPAPTFAYQWQTSPSPFTTWTNVGTNSNAYTVAAGDLSKKIRCQVTGSNTSGNVPALAPATAAVASGAPQPIVPPSPPVIT